MAVEIWARFGLVVGSVLGGAGAVILTVERIRGRALRPSVLAQRWLTWLVLSAVWMIAISSPIGRFVVLSLMGTLAAVEFGRLAGQERVDRSVGAILPITALVLTIAAGVEVALVLVLLAATVPSLVNQDIRTGVGRISRSLLGAVVSVAPILAIWAVGSTSTGAMVALLFGVALSDVTAFTFGSIAGKRRLAPDLSPNKTVAGAVGNVLGAGLGVGLTSVVFPIAAPVAVALVVVIALGSLWGDLLESLLKRSAGVKDAGTWLPGFGGILDRIDSLIVASLLVFVTVEIVGKHL